jgi:hypothetical protein
MDSIHVRFIAVHIYGCYSEKLQRIGLYSIVTPDSIVLQWQLSHRCLHLYVPIGALFCAC